MMMKVGAVATCSLPLVVALLLSLGLLPAPARAQYDVSMFRTYFGCPDCDPSACKNPAGCELVKEPGICGCCLTCARLQGEPCGINQERCARGLVCNPPINAINGFEALMNGKGICEPRLEYRGLEQYQKAVPLRRRRTNIPFPPRW